MEHYLGRSETTNCHGNNDAELCCWFEPDIHKKFKMIVDELKSLGYSAYFYSSNAAISVKSEGIIVNINCMWKMAIMQ